MHVNLIPLKMRLRLLARRQLRKWGAVWTVLAIVALSALLVPYRQVWVGQRQLLPLRVRVHPLREVQQETALLQTRLYTLEGELKLLQSIEPTDHSLELMMILSSAAQSIGEPLQIQQMRLINERDTVSSNSQNQLADVNTSAPPQLSMLTLQGVATSDRALARFVDALRSSPPLQQVELKSSNQWQAGSLSGRQFQVECRFAE